MGPYYKHDSVVTPLIIHERSRMSCLLNEVVNAGGNEETILNYYKTMRSIRSKRIIDFQRISKLVDG